MLVGDRVVGDRLDSTVLIFIADAVRLGIRLAVGAAGEVHATSSTRNSEERILINVDIFLFKSSCS
jgi:hypothetical protein